MSYVYVTTMRKEDMNGKRARGARVGLDGGKGMGGSDTIIYHLKKKKMGGGEEQIAKGLIEIKAETKATRADEDPPAGDENHVWKTSYPVLG